MFLKLEKCENDPGKPGNLREFYLYPGKLN